MALDIETNADKVQERKGKKLPQYLAGIVATINAMSAGCICGWTSPALLYLQGSEGDLPPMNASLPLTEPGPCYISVEQGSLAGSLAPIGAFVGSIPAGFLANLLGRRLISQILSIPMLVGWFIITFSGRQVAPLYLARFIHGMCVGIGSVVTPLYNEEIAEVSVRGSLGSLYDFAVGLGVLWVYLAGTVMSYTWMNFAVTIPSILSFVMLFLVPKSPVYLLLKGQEDQARMALLWLRGEDYDIEAELSSMRKMANKGKNVSLRSLLHSAKQLDYRSLTTPCAKSLMIVAALMTARQLSGIYAITFYAVEVFKEAGSSLNDSVSATVCALFDLGVTAAMVFVAEMAGRRTLLMASCWGCAFFLALLAAGPPGWLPIVSVIGYNTAFSLGLGPIPWFMIGELVPTECKSWVASIVVTLNWFLMFMVTQFFMSTVNAIGHLPTYICYAVVNAIAGLGVLLFMPETRGKTLDMIQRELSNN